MKFIVFTFLVFCSYFVAVLNQVRLGMSSYYDSFHLVIVKPKLVSTLVAPAEVEPLSGT